MRKGQPKRTLPANAGSLEAGRAAAARQASGDMFAGQGSASPRARGVLRQSRKPGRGERCLHRRSAAAPARRCSPTAATTTTTISCRPRTPSRSRSRWSTTCASSALNAKHRTDGVRPWLGDSIGWWEGDTLVVETTNYPAQPGLQRLVGSNLKVTERFTRVGAEPPALPVHGRRPDDVGHRPGAASTSSAPLNGRSTSTPATRATTRCGTSWPGRRKSARRAWPPSRWRRSRGARAGKRPP